MPSKPTKQDASKERGRRWRANNREHSNAYYRRLHHAGRTWAARNPDKIKAKRRRRTLAAYGLTPDTWNEVFEAQGRACAICRSSETRQWHTDHDHETNKFRGILCHKCNNGIGQLKDNPGILRAAANYIEKHK